MASGKGFVVTTAFRVNREDEEKLGQRVFQANTLVTLTAAQAKKFAAYLTPADEVVEEAINTPGYTRAISVPGKRSKTKAKAKTED